LKHVPLAAKRLTGIVSRGGAIIGEVCLAHRQENFTYKYFREICEIMKAYDVAFSLGDGLRPDRSPMPTTMRSSRNSGRQGKLTRYAWDQDVQVMNEGPGHVPLNLIWTHAEAARLVRRCALLHAWPADDRHCPGLRPHHLGDRAAMIGACGTALLCYVTPKEHLGLPNRDDVKAGVIAYKIAAHAADLGKDHPIARHGTGPVEGSGGVQVGDQFSLALIRSPRRAYHDADPASESSKAAHFCSMCGPQFCSLELNQQVREYAASLGLTGAQRAAGGVAGEAEEPEGVREIYGDSVEPAKSS